MNHILKIVILSAIVVQAAVAATPEERADRALAALARHATPSEAKALTAEREARRAKGFGHGYALGYQQGYADGLAGRYVDHRPAHGDPQSSPFYRGYEEGWMAASFPRP